MKDRDKFLTEAMGECWHSWSYSDRRCLKCNLSYTIIHVGFHIAPKDGGYIDFSTWEGFGKLWAWAIGQKWWDNFRWDIAKSPPHWIPQKIINPDNFANAIYGFLKENNK